ncbi:GGDEF domain-containing protein [Sporosarcina thermotolerans]|uniref:GGDEF domain-containing protein n=1 Tax=Sporosarcina thermotolerans TaxID=633404 RepID=A0AAW9A4Q2_9BACL|nr:GGDEF domain-containing protein [Sporosarcina thermotolerans]MDW0116082.1 GGDEF domain-containing protein [Sporosarcina thermotolerans]WHT48053.1 GGDEF domain-containing protein [Sporosarcina thermotolerans]
MRFNGRIIAIGVVGLFNVMRYFYYHQYLNLPFKADFFILTTFFLIIALWGGKQFDRVKYFSEKDPLTDTFNRRTIERFFQRNAKVCDKNGKKLGVILIDINDFKAINDTYGHHKGDELLTEIATSLKKSVDKKDLVARWGGDEFLILVPNCTDGFRAEYIKNLHQAFEEHLDGFPTVRASIGFSIYPGDGQNFQELVQKADEAMYRDKKDCAQAV